MVQMYPFASFQMDRKADVEWKPNNHYIIQTWFGDNRKGHLENIKNKCMHLWPAYFLQHKQRVKDSNVTNGVLTNEYPHAKVLYELTSNHIQKLSLIITPKYKTYIYKILGWVCSSVIEHLPSMYEALGSFRLI